MEATPQRSTLSQRGNAMRCQVVSQCLARSWVFLQRRPPSSRSAPISWGDLGEFVRQSKLTQAEAARRLGVSQSRVSDLTRGKWQKFSLEMLISLASRAGHKVEVRVVA
jgi:hypothetical protein